MNELQKALAILAAIQAVIAKGGGVADQVMAVFAAHGLEADTAALDAVVSDAERRKAQAEADAKG